MRATHFAAFACLALSAFASAADAPATHWEWCGWGGGGYFWAAAWHPTKPGTIYMGGDCLGMYRSDDGAKHWKIINNGLAHYAVYSVAVDRKSPDTVYAATEAGLCKSTDAGEHWEFLPETGRKKLRITGERNVSVHAIAVDPSDGRIVYAASPGGRLYKSEDGARSWAAVYTLAPVGADEPDALQCEFAGGAPFGAFLLQLKWPADANTADCKGLGLTFKGGGIAPGNAYVTVWGPNGAVWRSRDLREMFEKTEWQDVVLTADDFTIDPQHAKQKPEQAKGWPKRPDWGTVHRMDFTCAKMSKTAVGFIRAIYYSLGDARKVVLKDFSNDKSVSTYGSIHTGAPKLGSFASVCVSAKEPQTVLAASSTSGAILSGDGGKSWTALQTPKAVKSVAISESDPSVFFAACAGDGVYKSTDKGKTWVSVSAGIDPKCSMTDVAISPENPQDVYCIGRIGWNGKFYHSQDGGKSWADSSQVAMNFTADATERFSVDEPPRKTKLSNPTTIAICPSNPRTIFLPANWRPCVSEDGGKSWTESDYGADISCVQDIRFHEGRTYVAVMDEGLLESPDHGATWLQVWPKREPQVSGHYWRVIAGDVGGANRLIGTCSPWNYPGNCVLVSDDGGKTHKVSKAGLPKDRPTLNTMWGQGYPRALAADPKDPKVLYMGIDGDNAGIFKSEDGGYTWKQLEHQPGSRRMFYGLAVDPTDSKRLYWGSCGERGGLYRSEDAGESWQLVMKDETWVFNLLVTADGTVYCPGKNLWRSTDHGNTWKKLTNGNEGQIVGLEVNPADAKTIWFSTLKWGGERWGYVMKSSDGGGTWQDVTGDIGYRGPIILRFDPATSELWAGGVGLFKTRQ